MGIVSYKTRLIFDSLDDKQKILDTLIAARFCWNECSKIKFNIVDNSIVKLHAKFYKKFRSENINIPSQIVISSENSCLSVYKSSKTNKHKITKIHVKKSLSLTLDCHLFSYRDNIFNITSINKRVKCRPFIYPKLQELLGKYTFGGPKLFERNGDIWISLPFKIPEVNRIPEKAIGIDLGCRIPAATSEGRLYIDKKFNADKRKLRHLKDKLKSCGSRSAKTHLHKLRRKEHNKNKDFCHKLANKILKETIASIITLENLKSIKVKKHKYQNKNRISQIPMFELRRILTYKAPLLGKTVITVCPSYTSQIDHRTGKKDGIRSGSRYIGKDGQVMHADVNAACNIVLRSQHPASISDYFCWQAFAVTPIVS